MILDQILTEVASRLEAAGLYYGHGTETAWDEAAWLVLHIAGLPVDQPVPLDRQLTEEQIQQIEIVLVQRLESRKPLAYLLNSAWFCGDEFYVDERVIVPRSPIAELIQQSFSPWLIQSPTKILDLCAGSACIAIACAKQFPQTQIDATDISDAALSVANLNIERHGLSDRVHALQADVFSGLPKKKYDLIVSNPPYVDAEDMAALPIEYQHEPVLALASGQNGLDIVRRILSAAAEYLTAKGILICEVGNSEVALSEVYPDVPFMWLEFEYGGQGVFLLTAAELKQYRNLFV